MSSLDKEIVDEIESKNTNYTAVLNKIKNPKFDWSASDENGNNYLHLIFLQEQIDPVLINIFFRILANKYLEYQKIYLLEGLLQVKNKEKLNPVELLISRDNQQAILKLVSEKFKEYGIKSTIRAISETENEPASVAKEDSISATNLLAEALLSKDNFENMLNQFKTMPFEKKVHLLLTPIKKENLLLHELAKLEHSFLLNRILKSTFDSNASFEQKFNFLKTPLENTNENYFLHEVAKLEEPLFLDIILNSIKHERNSISFWNIQTPTSIDPRNTVCSLTNGENKTVFDICSNKECKTTLSVFSEAKPKVQEPIESKGNFNKEREAIEEKYFQL